MSNDFRNWKEMIIFQLDQLQQRDSIIEQELKKILIDNARLKTKSGIAWGVLGMLAGAVISSVIGLIFKFLG